MAMSFLPFLLPFAEQMDRVTCRRFEPTTVCLLLLVPTPKPLSSSYHGRDGIVLSGGIVAGGLDNTYFSCTAYRRPVSSVCLA